MSIFKYEVDASKVFDVLSEHILADGFKLVLDLENSKSGYFFDKLTGKSYIDFFTCYASMPIGMNHPKIHNDQFIYGIGKAALNKPSNSDIYTEEMATFVNTFAKIAMPHSFKYAFFVSGGALAVENGLKAAFDWKMRLNIAKGISEEKQLKILHFKEAFHGRSGYTMSLTNTDPKKVKYFPKFEWPRVSNPKIKFPLNDANRNELIEAELQSIIEIEEAFSKFKDEIAAIIIEPIQGEGGDNHFRKEFFEALRKIADNYDALLIFDEVQTGIALTGKMWAYEHFGVTPDIICFGKKMQVCGIIATERIDTIQENVFNTSSRINSTWGGNLVDMYRSAKFLEIIEEENLVDNSARMGLYLLDELKFLQSKYPEIISNARGRGLMCAFDAVNIETRQKIIDKCFENGLIILACGEKTIRFRPPLDINKDTLAHGLEVIEKSIK